MITPSCLTTKTQVGTFKETRGASYTYSKGKQFWIFWGTIPVGRTHVNTPGTGNCEVVTRFNLFDVCLSGITLGVVSSYTIKINTKRQDQLKGNPERVIESGKVPE